MPKLFDSHCHLNLPDFENDWQEVLDRTLAADTWLVNVGADLESSRLAVSMAETKPEGIWATVGFHPTDAVDLNEENWQEVARLAENPKVVAIGECGLEYARLNSGDLKSRDQQIEIFHRHIELALKKNLPLMIHCRDAKAGKYPYSAYEDIIAILKSYQKSGQEIKGNMHFFAGDWEIARQCLDLGLNLSFTGVITFAHEYDEVILKIPFERIMAETDAPFVAPVPFRGQRCEPIHVTEVVRRLAEIKDLSFEETARQTTDNALNFYFRQQKLI